FALLGQLGGVPIDADTERLVRDAEAIVEYFNRHFQFYGRRLRLVGYQGRGQIIPELQGAGQDAATNDSLRVANEIGAFADISATSQPYADALARNGVIALGAPYMSREWFEARRPYAWSTFPDCTAVAENSAPYTNRRLLGREATHAEGDLRGRSRTMAVVAPNNLEYQQCVDTFVEGLRAEGNDLAERLDYTIDIATLPATAASLISKLKSEENHHRLLRLRRHHADVPGPGGRGAGLPPRVGDRRRRLHRDRPRRADRRQQRARAVGAGVRGQPVGRAGAAGAERRPPGLRGGPARRGAHRPDRHHLPPGPRH